MTSNYDVLQSCWSRERQRREIQPLPEGFSTAMADYQARLREASRSEEKGTLKAKLVEIERTNAERMLTEVTQIRLRKIVTAEVEGAPVETVNMIPEERRLQAELRRLLAAYTQGMKQPLIDVQTPTEPPRQAPPPPKPFQIPEKASLSYTVVRFIQPLPAIMGTDMKTYGPFAAEDVASLPAQNAENLIRKGIAKVVETQR